MKYIKYFESEHSDYAINKFFINGTIINFVIDIENISNNLMTIIVHAFDIKTDYRDRHEYDIESFNKIKFMSEYDLFKYYPKLCAKLYLEIKSDFSDSLYSFYKSSTWQAGWYKKLYNMLNSMPELVEYSELYKNMIKYNL
jgi:hypothetical protein